MLFLDASEHHTLYVILLDERINADDRKYGKDHRTGLDISTISRVCNVKYCQTRWGTFRLRYFFNEGLRTDGGETLSTRKVKQLLKELVEKEDKQQPLNDDTLAAALKEQGYPVARRTVAKYREQLGIPISRMRRK